MPTLYQWQTPQISGAWQQSQPLRSSTGVWLFNPTAFTYQWQNSVDGANWSTINGANLQTYVPQSSDVGKLLRVLVAAINVSGPSIPAMSTPTGIIAPGVTKSFEDILGALATQGGQIMGGVL